MLGKLWYRQYAPLVFNLALCIMCRTRSRHDKRIAILAVSRFLGYLCWLSLVEIQSNISSGNLFHQRYLCLQFKFNGKFELLWWKAIGSPHICAHFMAAQLSCVEIYTENCIKLKWYQNNFFICDDGIIVSDISLWNPLHYIYFATYSKRRKTTVL